MTATACLLRLLRPPEAEMVVGGPESATGCRRKWGSETRTVVVLLRLTSCHSRNTRTSIMCPTLTLPLRRRRRLQVRSFISSSSGFRRTSWRGPRRMEVEVVRQASRRNCRWIITRTRCPARLAVLISVGAVGGGIPVVVVVGEGIPCCPLPRRRVMEVGVCRRRRRMCL